MLAVPVGHFHMKRQWRYRPEIDLPVVTVESMSVREDHLGMSVRGKPRCASRKHGYSGYEQSKARQQVRCRRFQKSRREIRRGVSQKIRKRNHFKKGEINSVILCREVHIAFLLWLLENDDDSVQTGTGECTPTEMCYTL